MQQRMNRPQSFNNEQQKRLRQQELSRRVEVGQQAQLIRELLESWLLLEREELLGKLKKALTTEELVLIRGQLLGVESFAERLTHLVNQGENAMAAIASSIPDKD